MDFLYLKKDRDQCRLIPIVIIKGSTKRCLQKFKYHKNKGWGDLLENKRELSGIPKRNIMQVLYGSWFE